VAGIVAVAAVVAFGIAARFIAFSHLWLDEALTVNIARLPVGEIPAALRHDGSPPLYYLLLHYWMVVFGSGTIAVRALSGLFSVACLPLAWMAGARLGGRRAAAAALVLLAASPYAVQYASEARMYSMIMFIVLAGGLALARLLEAPSRWAAVAVGVATGALLLSHYWSGYLVAVIGALLVRAVRRGNRPLGGPGVSPQNTGPRTALVAMVCGALPFLAWMPVFLFQARHTGAPWGAPGRGLRTVIDTVGVLVNGYKDLGPVPILLFEALIALAVFGRAVDRRRVELDLRGREPARSVALATFGALALGILASRLTGQAYAPRYAAMALPGVVVLGGLGVGVLADRRLRVAVLTIAVGYASLSILPIMRFERTQAPKVAAAIRSSARPGDVVAYCPDQLGPSVSRLLPAAGIDQFTFPLSLPPQLIDWVDYAKVNKAPTQPFADMLDGWAGAAHDVLLVWSPRYQVAGPKCDRLRRDLADLRTEDELVGISNVPERMGLLRYRPAKSRALGNITAPAGHRRPWPL
jgi:hypothetical protein